MTTWFARSGPCSGSLAQWMVDDEPDILILQRIRAAAELGSRVLIAYFWTDSTHTRPLAAALMAGEFAIHLNDGDVYNVDEGTAWLARAGWKATGHAPLAGPITSSWPRRCSRCAHD